MIILGDSNVIGQPSGILLQNLIATVIDLTVTAWSQVISRAEVDETFSEPQIAGVLGRAMLQEKKRRPHLKSLLRIEEEVGTRSSIDVPKPEGRIDIKILYSFDEEEYFGMECKRISTNDKALTKKYITEGVMRFVTGKYSPGHVWAAMLAFVIDGDIAGGINLIQKYLEQFKEEAHIERNWETDSRFGDYTNLYGTNHKQASHDSLITILHLFLGIPNLNSTS